MAKTIDNANFQYYAAIGADDSTFLRTTPTGLDVGVATFRSDKNSPNFLKMQINPSSEEDFIPSGSPLMAIGYIDGRLVVDLAKKQSDNSYPALASVATRISSDVINNVYNTTTNIKYSRFNKGDVVDFPDLTASSVEFDVNVVFGEDMIIGDDVTYSDTGEKYIKWTTGKVKVGRVIESALLNKVGRIRIIK